MRNQENLIIIYSMIKNYSNPHDEIVANTCETHTTTLFLLLVMFHLYKFLNVIKKCDVRGHW